MSRNSGNESKRRRASKGQGEQEEEGESKKRARMRSVSKRKKKWARKRMRVRKRGEQTKRVHLVFTSSAALSRGNKRLVPTYCSAQLLGGCPSCFETEAHQALCPE